MAKETQKSKIERLEKEIKEWIELSTKLNKEISIMQERGDNSFLNSALHKQLLRENKELKIINKTLKDLNEHLEDKHDRMSKKLKIAIVDKDGEEF